MPQSATTTCYVVLFGFVLYRFYAFVRQTVLEMSYDYNHSLSLRLIL